MEYIKMKPIIGILPMINAEGHSYIVDSYIPPITKSGGLPLLIPYTEDKECISEYVKLCDGFLFAGGPDIEPWRYGEQKAPECGECTPPRDAVELLFFPEILKSGKPILGICRGSQLINIALGGSLYQDIPTDIGKSIAHRQIEPHNSHSHEAAFDECSPLLAIFGTKRAKINSFHHQAIKELGRGLSVMARADDGIIEAAYAPEHKFLWALQWHPERLFECDEPSKKIFGAFICACAKTR